jgi:hypothetical protein
VRREDEVGALRARLLEPVESVGGFEHLQPFDLETVAKERNAVLRRRVSSDDLRHSREHRKQSYSRKAAGLS